MVDKNNEQGNTPEKNDPSIWDSFICLFPEPEQQPSRTCCPCEDCRDISTTKDVESLER